MKKRIIFLLFLLPFCGFAQDDPPPQIDWSQRSNERIDPASVQEFYRKGTVVIGRRNQRMGMIGAQGRVLIPFEFNHLEFSKNTPFVFAYDSKFKWGVLDTFGHEILPFVWRGVFDFQTDKIQAHHGIGPKAQISIYDAEGKFLQSVPFKSLRAIGDGRFIASKDSTDLMQEYQTLVDEKYCPVYPFKYTYFDWVKGDWAFAIHHKLRKRGLLRLSNDHYLPIPDSINFVGQPDTNGLLVFEIGQGDGNKKYGMLDTALRVVYEAKFISIKHLHGQQYLSLLPNQRGYALGNAAGKQLSEPVYNPFSQLTMVVEPPVWTSKGLDYRSKKMPFFYLHNEKTRKQALIHLEKGWITPDTCEDIRVVSDESFLLKTGAYPNERWQLFGLDGRPISQLYEEMRGDYYETIYARNGLTVQKLDKKGQLIKEIPSEAIPKYLILEERRYFVLQKKSHLALCDEQFQPLTDYIFTNIDSDRPEGWFAPLKNKSGFARWLGTARLVDGTRVAIDENGKTCPCCN